MEDIVILSSLLFMPYVEIWHTCVFKITLHCSNQEPGSYFLLGGHEDTHVPNVSYMDISGVHICFRAKGHAQPIASQGITGIINKPP